MSKMRKSVVKQQERTQAPKRPAVPRPTAAATEANARDNYLYSSAKRAFVLSVGFFILSMLSAGSFWPFDALRNLNTSVGVAFDLLTGGLCLSFFVFLIFAWGNALEIRGNVIEWKHILVCIIVSVLIALWGSHDHMVRSSLKSSPFSCLLFPSLVCYGVSCLNAVIISGP
jgi:hypothetical protein